MTGLFAACSGHLRAASVPEGIRSCSSATRGAAQHPWPREGRYKINVSAFFAKAYTAQVSCLEKGALSSTCLQEEEEAAQRPKPGSA